MDHSLSAVLGHLNTSVRGVGPWDVPVVPCVQIVMCRKYVESGRLIVIWQLTDRHGDSVFITHTHTHTHTHTLHVQMYSLTILVE